MNQNDRLTIQARREDIPKAALESEFVTLLCLLEAGDLVSRLSEEATELIQAVQTHGKTGTLQFTMKVGAGGRRKLEVEVATKVSKPKEPSDMTILFADDRGQVYGADPDQMLLNFSAKTVPIAEPKAAPAAPEAKSIPSA